jgi:polyisoprenoid-binding protein YceI
MRKFIAFAVGMLLATSVFAADYKIDAAHSSINFSAKHMMVSKTSGSFDQFDGTISYDPNNLANSKISISIPVSSINTRNANRDAHLKTADFFDAEKFPEITFVSKSITPTEIKGDLTIKGVTKEVTIPATFTGPVAGMAGNEIIGINGSFTINRQDYGVSYNKSIDKGGLAVSNDIPIDISIEAGTEAPKK